MVSKAAAKDAQKGKSAHEEIESPWTLMWKRFKKNKIAMSGLYIFGFLLVFCYHWTVCISIRCEFYGLCKC